VPNTPSNPIHVTNFNLKNASPTFGPKDQDMSKMYHNTAPPTINEGHYASLGAVSNFADIGDKNVSHIKMSSFQNSMATKHEKPPHSAFISVQMMKSHIQAKDSRRCRLPSNEYSHDIATKIKKGD
jgi:hypothetical protein